MAAYDEFRNSLADASPPVGFGPALQALWWAGKGDWRRAHLIAGEWQDDGDCNLVHAHLHRAEGDVESAGHWYEQAARTPSSLSIEEEWSQIASEFSARRDTVERSA